MIILLSILLISVLIILGMLFYRSYELKSGKVIISERIRAKGSEKVLNFAVFVSKNFIDIKVKTIKFFKELPYKTQLFLHDIWIKTYPKIDAYFHGLKGRKHFFRKDD